MAELTEIYKLRFGNEKFEELLSSGKLPTDLMANNIFD